MATFNFKQGDSAPPLQDTLTDENNDPIDLSNADNVKLFVDDGGDSPTLIVNDTVTITDATNGEIEYQWGSQLGAEPGSYRLEYLISFNDGDTRTVPDRGFETLVIAETTARNVGLASQDDGDATVTTLFVDEIQGNTASEVDVNVDIDMNGNQIGDSTGPVQFDAGLDANGNNVTNVGALNTDKVTIGSYGPVEFIGSDTGNKSSLNVSLPDLSNYRRIHIICPALNTDAATDVELVFDEDDSNSNYFYRDDDGTDNNNANTLTLFNTMASGFRNYSTSVVAHTNTSGNIALSQHFGIASSASLSDLGSYLDAGGYGGGAPSSSVEIRNLNSSKVNQIFVVAEKS